MFTSPLAHTLSKMHLNTLVMNYISSLNKLENNEEYATNICLQSIMRASLAFTSNSKQRQYDMVLFVSIAQKVYYATRPEQSNTGIYHDAIRSILDLEYRLQNLSSSTSILNTEVRQDLILALLLRSCFQLCLLLCVICVFIKCNNKHQPIKKYLKESEKLFYAYAATLPFTSLNDGDR
ncbi:hypothetical protein GQX74_002756 [Glossina fuscipes]|nr:hypothetical protein GQX74_002756 [Glossina fuscipes]